VLSRTRDDDIEELATAQRVVGVGMGVKPDEYSEIEPLLHLLDAQLAATRKVTDKAWLPRARQIGITGHSIAPQLYIGVGLSGKFNHSVGIRAAGTVVAVNIDPEALIFDHADIGIVGDWHEVVPRLTARLAEVIT
jgi:electron transfer flavoprotein alpha subunit